MPLPRHLVVQVHLLGARRRDDDLHRHNVLERLPESVERLGSLRELNASSNELSALPALYMASETNLWHQQTDKGTSLTYHCEKKALAARRACVCVCVC